MKKVIESIGNVLVEKFYDFGNLEYDGGCVEEYNNIYEPETITISFGHSTKNHDIDCSLKMSGGKVEYFEVLVDCENCEKALEDYVRENISFEDLWREALDDMRENAMDEWQRNGFSDAADYWSYRVCV